jgi:hypothetical protein
LGIIDAMMAIEKRETELPFFCMQSPTQHKYKTSADNKRNPDTHLSGYVGGKATKKFIG